MNREVLTKYEDPSLRVYMVWVPKLRGLERDVASATREVKDPRAAHYWDAPSVLVRGYREQLQLSEDAWDIFLLYGPDAKWEGERPPEPSYWSHQLGSKDKPRIKGPWLDGAVFLEQLRRLAGRPEGREAGSSEVRKVGSSEGRKVGRSEGRWAQGSVIFRPSGLPTFRPSDSEVTAAPASACRREC